MNKRHGAQTPNLAHWADYFQTQIPIIRSILYHWPLPIYVIALKHDCAFRPPPRLYRSSTRFQMRYYFVYIAHHETIFALNDAPKPLSCRYQRSPEPKCFQTDLMPQVVQAKKNLFVPFIPLLYQKDFSINSFIVQGSYFKGGKYESNIGYNRFFVGVLVVYQSGMSVFCFAKISTGYAISFGDNDQP